MNILLLTTHLNMGGIGIYTVNLARYLNRRGINAGVASGGGDLVRVLDQEGVKHFELDIRTKAEFGIKSFRSVKRIKDIVRKNNFQIIHSQTRVTQVAGRIAGYFCGIPMVTTCHGFFRHRKLSRRLFPCWGNKAIAISRSVQEHLVHDLGVSESDTKVVYNGIELGKYAEYELHKDRSLLKDLELNGEKPVIGTLGRLSPVKGYRFLIKAMEILCSKGTDLRLLMIGDGPEKATLERMVSGAGLDGKVVITPGGKPLAKYFGLMDVFCMPSVHEGLGLSLMEAMASGRACIASNIGGLAELVIDGFDGSLVPAGDPEALAEAIEALVEDPEERFRYGWNARAKAMREFSIEKSVEKTISVYEQVLK
ncbi:MAG: glycosyltransferase [Candidatus Omnitrophica bacterium]|nr:glycosyltransferase [Candidatus Omnitrophota bacterium]